VVDQKHVVLSFTDRSDRWVTGSLEESKNDTHMQDVCEEIVSPLQEEKSLLKKKEVMKPWL
jgi:hypothetical protein